MKATAAPAHGSSAREELGAFLRAHRELLQPGDLGLPVTARRRTPGLRREEVASLSGVGLAWYTWLEQGRVVPSRQVLEALARTLRLDAVGRRYALRLAGYHEPQPPAHPADPDDPGGAAESSAERAERAELARSVLDAWPLAPGVLVDRSFDLLAWNRPWSVLLGDPARLPPPRRNLLWLMAADRRVRELLDEWEPLAMQVFQHFRAQAGAALAAPRTAELYRLLERDVPELSHWWGCHSVADLTTRRLTTRPPGGGAALGLVLSAFRPVDDAAALLLLLSPAAEPDRRAMSALLDAAG